MYALLSRELLNLFTDALDVRRVLSLLSIFSI